MAAGTTPLTDLTFYSTINNWFQQCGFDGTTLTESLTGSVYTTYGLMANWDTSQVTTMGGAFSDVNQDYFASTQELIHYFNQDIGLWNTVSVIDMSVMFRNAYTFNQNISSWNTSLVTNMSSMFYYASAFNQNISSWNTSKVTNMGSMFAYAATFNQPLATNGFQWNTSKVTDMSGMFEGASSFNQNISSWNTSLVTDMSSMFQGASAFNQNISSWNTSAVTDMRAMFGYSYDSIVEGGASVFNQDISSWNTSLVTDMSGMFNGALAFNQPLATDGNKWNTSLVTDMSNMFQGASAFNQNISSWNTSAVTDMRAMFGYSYDSIVEGGASVFNQDISSWNTSLVTDMSSMFQGALAFNQPLATDGNKWNTSLVTDMSNMFQGASAFNQNISSWNTSLVTDMSEMFARALAFNQNISSWNTSKVIVMSAMFAQASAFNQPLATDGFQWNTSLVTDMSYMFRNASTFNQDISSWNTSKVTDMQGMFTQASAFNQPLVTQGNQWDTSKVISMSSMFEGASVFNKNISSWNTSAVIDMSYMFSGASAFNQNISSWNTSLVINMSSMFFEAFAFNQNISSWNTSLVTDMSYMFRNAFAFNQNISSWNLSLKPIIVEMFIDSAIPVTANNDTIYTTWNTEYAYTDAELTAAGLTTPTPYKECTGTPIQWATISDITLINKTLADAPVVIPIVLNSISAQTGIPVATMCVSGIRAGSLIFTVQIVYGSEAEARAGAVAIEQVILPASLGPYTLITRVVPPAYLSNICFPAGTKIKTDQGEIAIENIRPGVNTIHGKAIKHITRTISREKCLIQIKNHAFGRNKPNKTTIMSKDHRVEYDGQMVPAYRLLDYSALVTKVNYNGEFLYNVLLEEYGSMSVNNMRCETLNPTSPIGCLYRGVAYKKEEARRKVEMFGSKN